MKKFLQTRVGIYLFYAVLFAVTTIIGSFQDTVVLALICILGDLHLIEINTPKIEKKEETRSVPDNEPLVELSQQKSPHEVVLVALNTNDCGWCIKTAWWNEKNNCWMVGQDGTEFSHLKFTHWKKLPKPPMD